MTGNFAKWSGVGGILNTKKVREKSGTCLAMAGILSILSDWKTCHFILTCFAHYGIITNESF